MIERLLQAKSFEMQYAMLTIMAINSVVQINCSALHTAIVVKARVIKLIDRVLIEVVQAFKLMAPLLVVEVRVLMIVTLAEVEYCFPYC